MKKIIKVLSIILSMAMIIGTMTSCDGKKKTSDDEVTTVTVWTCNSHSKQEITEACDHWNETTGKEKNIKIDYQVKSADSIIQNTEIALEGGTAPDFFGSGNLKKFASNNDIMPISDLPGTEEILKKYKDLGLSDEGRGVYKGKVYQVPTGADVGGLIYNKDMFKAAGIVDEQGNAKAPETFEEMRECAKKLTNVSKKQYGIIYPMKWEGWFSSDLICPKMTSDGYEQYNPETGKYDYSGFKPVMESIVGMRDDGSVYPGAESLDNDTARALFAEGNIGMKMGFSFDVGVYNDQFVAKIDWGVAPYPSVDKNEKHGQRMDYSYSFYINKNSKVDKAKLAEVFKFFVSDEYIRNEYEKGTRLPYDWNIVKDIKLKNAKKGWEDFAKIVSVSAIYPQAPSIDKSGIRTADVIFIEDVYSGKISIDEGIKRMDENMNKAMDNYYAAHTDEDKEEFHNANFKSSKR